MAELYTIKESNIHNKGVYASTFIKKGTDIIQYVGEKITKKESERRAHEWDKEARTKGFGLVYIFELNKRFDIDGNVPNNPAKYINHSCDPNCEAVNMDNEIWIVAKRDIQEGEELSYDYGYDFENYAEHECRCMSDNCIGYIVREEERPRVLELLNA